MATYRTYKNGIYGKKYKKYYIVPPKNSEEKIWSVVNEKNDVMKSGIHSFYDAIWEIDKLCATEDEMRAINLLYQQDVPSLVNMIELMGAESRLNGLSANEQMMYDFAIKVRERKIEGKLL